MRDRWGIPHVYARSEHDLFFGNGVVHAEDRLLQMELNRRAARGRLSELIGPATLEVDRFMRAIGLERAARAEIALLDPPTRAMIDAYAAGVNWAIESRPRPPELLALRHSPQPWTDLDTLAWAKLMGWGISANWGSELARARLVTSLGPELAAELEPVYPPGGFLIGEGVGLAAASAPLRESFEIVRELTGLGQFAGSNAWAVAPSRSATGGALLASDLHLAPAMPSVWYELTLHASDGRGLDLAGVSLAGIPGIVNGHNGQIAWGTPASLADVQDLYVERPHPDDPRLFARGDGWERAEVVREEIRVRGRRRCHLEEVLVSSNGVVITPLLRGVEVPVSLRTTAAEASRTLRAGRMLLHARGWAEFRAALADWGTPSLSFVYADRAGNIGYQMAGLVPRRGRKATATVPSPGWDPDYGWQGFLSIDELPHVENPPEGFVAAANNQPIGPSYPFALGSDWCDSYRIGRIVELLRARPRHDRASMAAIQLDVRSNAAREFVARVREILGDEQPLDPLERDALARLYSWDGSMAVDSVAASIYQYARARLVTFLYAPRLGELLDLYLGVAPHPFSGSSLLWRSSSHLLAALADPDWPEKMGHPGLTWRDVLLIGLGEGVSALRQGLGEDPQGWQWGRIHTLRLEHPLARLRPLRRLLSRGGYPIGGDGDTPLQTGAAPWNVEAPVAVVPSNRQIVDLDDPGRSASVIPGGQSGHPLSRHYADQIELFRRGEYHPMLWTRADVEASLEAETRLLPTDELWPRP
ncbi:MAG TPA: penicillin acylase family protein [Chloroflexota bacterium]